MTSTAPPPPPASLDPLARFREAFARACAGEDSDATAMSLATADALGRPSARMVLLKEADERGFVFFTNHGSRKGHDLESNPFAALCFHWATAMQQVRVEGPVERIAGAESDVYFASRPRGSQLGAWASEQSAELASPAELEARVREVATRFEGGPVPRPPFWGGYRVVPERIEFWQGRADRLHVRELYVRDGDGWRLTHLYP